MRMRSIPVLRLLLAMCSMSSLLSLSTLRARVWSVSRASQSYGRVRVSLSPDSRFTSTSTSTTALSATVGPPAPSHPQSQSPSPLCTAATPNPHLLSVAPMMEYTDRHQRRLQRLICKEAVLYTEMVTTNAIVRGDAMRFLQADLPAEEPLVLQLGGSDPEQMRVAAGLAVGVGYREININVGCPSEKVAGAGCFGAALMLNPPLVAELALAVSSQTNCPATVKCRIGVDDRDSYEELVAFVRTVSEKGNVGHFIVHARKAVLNANFSPHDNRSIPPLRYDFVTRLTADFPHLEFTLNGGVQSVAQAKAILLETPRLRGVMVGRAVVNAPFSWSDADSEIYGKKDGGISRRDILQTYAAYCDAEEARIGPRITRTLIKPVLNLFHAEPKGKLFRNIIDTFLKENKGGGAMSAGDMLLTASGCIDEWVLDARSNDTAYGMRGSSSSSSSSINSSSSKEVAAGI
ncbi:dihydrouridine synthase-domain-containing protein [Ochromonadaceae sp. CCMP2298]|nr:dihydrouridine synthase-domain-containing protein [Ochromonadaceae sp. CCMP2298]